MSFSLKHLPENSRIVQAEYLQKHSSRKDLVRRLKALTDVLANDTSIEPDSDEWPGLASVAELLVRELVDHKDKEIRLYSVLACMEIFAIYAPDSPYSETEIFDIFRQTIRQVAGLAVVTGPSMSNYTACTKILELLAEVQIGVLLVELARTSDDTATPQELLGDLVHTLLQSVRREHAPEILVHVQKSITAIVDEYSPSSPVPIRLLDELLVCIGQGPTVLVANPAAGANKKEPLQIPQPNPSYLAAAEVLRASLNRLAPPVASLINGVLEGTAYVTEQSSLQSDRTMMEQPDSVYAIIYHLHAVAPQMLTTVVGTVSGGLKSTDVVTRTASVDLLGKLFADSSLVEDYAACFREWLTRQTDVEPSIRRAMVGHLVRFLQAHPDAAMAHPDAVAAAVRLTTDPVLEVRMDAIYKICDYAFRASTPAPAKLLHAIGDRVSAKNRDERKNALTGLSQIYFRHYIGRKLAAVQAGGDDCDLAVVSKALHDMCHGMGRSRRRQSTSGDDEDEAYAWIPSKVFACVYFTDEIDSDMRSRVVQIVDEILLGSELSSTKSKRLSPTARAVGLTAILDSFTDEGENLLVAKTGKSRAFKCLRLLFERRAQLQKAVVRYLEARAKVREHQPDEEAYLVADAEALQQLQVIASFVHPVTSANAEDVLLKFHQARDKHIFRILSTITDPLQKSKARARALDELPKRTKTLGDAVSTWVKNLVRRCSMGDFINADVIGHCVLLAQESFYEKDLGACAALLVSVKTAVSLFPALCSEPKTFETLSELFSECRAVSDKGFKKTVEESGILTALSSILPKAAPLVTGLGKNDGASTIEQLQKELLQLCTRDGTPEQARNAVYTLARLLVPDQLAAQSPEPSRKNTEALSSMLQALTSPSRLTIGPSDESCKVVSILSALSALTDCVPDAFESDRGQKAVKFALETILMGRDLSGDSDESSDEEEESQKEAKTPFSGRKKSKSPKKQHVSPEAVHSLLENEKLSVPCRRICAAIEFLVCYIRSSTLVHFKPGQPLPTVVPPEIVCSVFKLLEQILRDNGLPPSSRDRKSCKARQDRAALRQCAATQLLRLCDSRLRLELKHLSVSMWHTLGDAFLDEERVVRVAVMEEFMDLLRGTGVYGMEGSRRPKQPPPLRLIAFMALCSDGDHGQDNDASNGNAANVGKVGLSVKVAVRDCTFMLRKLCADVYSQCLALGRNGEAEFQAKYKPILMLDNAVPYALHLLTLRRETPAMVDDKDDSPKAVDDESQHRVLRKRLKLLYEPIIQSLGERADNLSFLIRISETLAKDWVPVDPTQGRSNPLDRLSIGSDSSLDTKPSASDNERLRLLECKLKTVSQVSRQVLFSFLKKDINLNPFAGAVSLPVSLFRRSQLSAKRPLQTKAKRSTASSKRSTTGTMEKPVDDVGQSPETSFLSPPPAASSRHRKSSTERSDSAKKSRVHFSPEVEIRLKSAFRPPPSGEEGEDDFGDVSPIVKSESPAMPRGSVARIRVGPSVRSGESPATLGSTPPSAMRGATMLSTAPDLAGDTQSSKEDSVAMPPPAEKVVSPTARRGRVTRQQQRLSQESAESKETSLGSTSTLTKHTEEIEKHGIKRKSTNEDTKKAGPVPKQIKINRVKSIGSTCSSKGSQKRSSTKAAAADEFDFSFDDENYSLSSRNKKSKAAGSKQVGRAGTKSKTATAAKTAAARKGRSRH